MSDVYKDNVETRQALLSANINGLRSYLQSLVPMQPKDSIAQRDYVLRALGETISLLSSIRLSAHQVQHLRALFSAIDDLDSGVIAPMLQPCKTLNRQPTLMWLAKAHVAVALEARFRGGRQGGSEAS